MTSTTVLFPQLGYVLGVSRDRVPTRETLSSGAAVEPEPTEIEAACDALHRAWLLTSRPGGLEDSLATLHRREANRPGLSYSRSRPIEQRGPP